MITPEYTEACSKCRQLVAQIRESIERDSSNRPKIQPKLPGKKYGTFCDLILILCDLYGSTVYMYTMERGPSVF